MDANLYNGLALAYIGDAVFEVEIRNYAILIGYTKANRLHKFVSNYVSAVAQAKIVHYMLDNKILTPKEEEIFLRGRNAKVRSYHKNVDINTYHDATGFEAIFGYLYLTNNKDRISELINFLKEGDIINE